MVVHRNLLLLAAGVLLSGGVLLGQAVRPEAGVIEPPIAATSQPEKVTTSRPDDAIAELKAAIVASNRVLLGTVGAVEAGQPPRVTIKDIEPIKGNDPPGVALTLPYVGPGGQPAVVNKRVIAVVGMIPTPPQPPGPADGKVGPTTQAFVLIVEATAKNMAAACQAAGIDGGGAAADPVGGGATK